MVVATRRTKGSVSGGPAKQRTSQGQGDFAALDAEDKGRRKRRGWREVEAWRERKSLREMLADIWDDDLMIDESVFSSAESEADLYTDFEDVEVEDDLLEYDDEAFFDDED